MKRFTIILLLLLSLSPICAQQYKDGGELVKDMYNRYKGKFYKTLTFSQRIINFQGDSIVSEDIMHEAYMSPSFLILKFSSWESGNGLIFRNDSLYTIEKGVLKDKRQLTHDLLILGLDMYNCEPEVTLNRLQKSGYDYSKITEGTYRNQDIWIVGDQSAKSFYVDKKSLLFIRMQDKLGRSVDFLDYQLFNNKPVATHILFYNKLGKLYMEEIYFDVKVDAQIGSEIFNPGNFVQSRW